MLKKYLVVTACVIIAACSPKLIEPTVADETKAKQVYSDITLAELQQGHKLYIEKCGKCHKLFHPDSHSEAEWKKILPVMGKKAKLDQDQYRLVERYVYATRSAGKK